MRELFGRIWTDGYSPTIDVEYETGFVTIIVTDVNGTRSYEINLAAATIADRSISHEKLELGTITNDEMGADSVDTPQIVDGSITDDKLEKPKANVEDLAAVATSGSYADLSDVPTKVSDFSNDAGYINQHQDITGKADLDSNDKVEADQASSSIVSVTASRTLALTDAGKFLNVNSSSDLTITVPANASVAFPVGTEIEFCRFNTGAVTFAGATGVTLVSLDSVKTISDQYCCVGLKKIDTDTWILSGAVG